MLQSITLENKFRDLSSDEEDCQNNYMSNIILGVSSALVLVLFIGLTVYYYFNEQNTLNNHNVPKSKSEILANYIKNHDDKQIIEEVNLYLLHSINTQKVEDSKNTLIEFYNIENEKHNQNEAEIYHYMHKNLDPSVVSKMIDAKFPGCLEPIKKLFQKVDNYIIQSENVKKILSVTLALIKIEVKYIDMCKDLGLTFLMLRLIGGPQALIDLPDNFGSVIVSVMLGSIFIPMILSSVHLMNSEHVADKILKGSSKSKRFLKTGLYYLLSPFHPIILDKLQYQKLEEARTLAQQYNIRATNTMKQCRTLKRHQVTFIKIELGIKYNCFFFGFLAILAISFALARHTIACNIRSSI